MLTRLHLIETGLWVGSCPTRAEHSRWLADQGIGAVLCLQTDTDLQALGLRWEVIWRCHIAAGLLVERVPIKDFDKKDLAAQVEDAVDAALRLRAALEPSGRALFIHCSAGLNRSTTIAIATLVAIHGISLEDAEARLLAAHPNAVPYVDTLTRWLKRRA